VVLEFLVELRYRDSRRIRRWLECGIRCRRRCRIPLLLPVLSVVLLKVSHTLLGQIETLGPLLEFCFLKMVAISSVFAGV
jgi:hypothetical protein